MPNPHPAPHCKHCKEPCSAHTTVELVVNVGPVKDWVSDCCSEPLVSESGSLLSNSEIENFFHHEKVHGYVPE